MANRAYLYPAEDPMDLLWPKFERPYYDSRHVIPFGWFYFYEPTSIVSVPVQTWTEFLLVRDRGDAIHSFRQRQEALLSIVGHLVSRADLEGFVSNIANWTGKCLVMSANEVLGGISDDDERDFASFLAILKAIAETEGRVDRATYDLINKYSFIESVPQTLPSDAIIGKTKGS